MRGRAATAQVSDSDHLAKAILGIGIKETPLGHYFWQ